MGKIAYVAIAAVMAATLAGCAGSGTQEKEVGEQKVAQEEKASEKEEPKIAETGDVIEIYTDFGDIAVSVDGFSINDDMTSHFAEYGQIQDGKAVGLLKMTVENISFEYQDGFVPLGDFVYTEDDDGVALSMMNSSIDMGEEYTPEAGGYYIHPKGKTMRVAIPYVSDPEMTEVTAVVADYEITVPVS